MACGQLRRAWVAPTVRDVPRLANNALLRVGATRQSHAHFGLAAFAGLPKKTTAFSPVALPFGALRHFQASQLNAGNARIRALAAWSLACSACLSPWLVATRTAKFRAGASQMVAYQLVLLPPWLSAAPPAQDARGRIQPPAYSHDGGGMCKVFSVAGFKSFDHHARLPDASAANLAQSGIEQWTVPAGPSEGHCPAGSASCHGRRGGGPRARSPRRSRPGVPNPADDISSGSNSRVRIKVSHDSPRNLLGHQAGQRVADVRVSVSRPGPGQRALVAACSIISACRAWVVVVPGRFHHGPSCGKPARCVSKCESVAS